MPRRRRAAPEPDTRKDHVRSSQGTGIQKDTLRRRLNEAGMLAQNPPPAGAS